MDVFEQLQPDASIIIGDNIEIQVKSIDGKSVKLYIDAPIDVAVNRKEVFERIQKEKKAAASKPAIKKLVRKFRFGPG